MPDKKPKTYVFVGHDAVMWDRFNPADKSPSSYHVFDASNFPLINGKLRPELSKKLISQIEPGANIILHCHGTPDGAFEWNQGAKLSYQSLFKQLSGRDISSIIVASCYGGTAQMDDMLRAVAPGTLVMSLSGAKTSTLLVATEQFGMEAEHLTKPIDLFLEILDNFDIKGYRRNFKYNAADIEDAMPHSIGIGGNPPHHINLAEEMINLSGKASSPPFIRALARVRARFDKDSYMHTKVEDPAPLITIVAHELSLGHLLDTPEKKRIGYALTAAYLDESGDLAGRIATATPRKKEGKHLPDIV